VKLAPSVQVAPPATTTGAALTQVPVALKSAAFVPVASTDVMVIDPLLVFVIVVLAGDELALAAPTWVDPKVSDAADAASEVAIPLVGVAM